VEVSHKQRYKRYYNKLLLKDLKKGNTVKTLFVDLDGTLCDFEKRVYELTGFYPKDFGHKAAAGGKGQMWKVLSRPENDFYNSLEWLDGCKDMWDSLQPYSPIILTGLPMGKWAAPQKREWCSRELGSHIPVITCLADDKPKAALEWLKMFRGWEWTDLRGAVLIDDRIKTKSLWANLGGTFILHTDPEDSLEQLNNIF